MSWFLYTTFQLFWTLACWRQWHCFVFSAVMLFHLICRSIYHLSLSLPRHWMMCSGLVSLWWCFLAPHVFRQCQLSGLPDVCQVHLFVCWSCQFQSCQLQEPVEICVRFLVHIFRERHQYFICYIAICVLDFSLHPEQYHFIWSLPVMKLYWSTVTSAHSMQVQMRKPSHCIILSSSPNIFLTENTRCLLTDSPHICLFTCAAKSSAPSTSRSASASDDIKICRYI